MIARDVGFVIKRMNFRDTSLLATLYTRQHGKINGLFKGFYSQKKEFASSLDVFTLNEFIFYPRKSDIWLVSFADCFKDYNFLRTDIRKNFAASVFLRIIQRCLGLCDPHPDIFTLLCDSFAGLESSAARRIIYIFIIKFLTISGFKPEFSLCIHCQQPYRKSVFFSIARGGLVCDACQSKKDDACPISLETSLAIRYIQNNDFPQCTRLGYSESCEEEIVFVLSKFLEYHLHFDPFPTLLCG